MKNKVRVTKFWLLLVTVCLCLVPRLSAQSENVSVYFTGLDNPRGLKFGPDGNLYVAEGGLGGTSFSTTAEQCEQVPGFPPGPGPYTGDFTARISKIDRHRVRTTVVDHLPSSQTNKDVGFLVSGVADVAFIGNTLYALIAGGRNRSRCGSLIDYVRKIGVDNSRSSFRALGLADACRKRSDACVNTGGRMRATYRIVCIAVMLLLFVAPSAHGFFDPPWIYSGGAESR